MGWYVEFTLNEKNSISRIEFLGDGRAAQYQQHKNSTDRIA
jgi:hypothetical protein